LLFVTSTWVSLLKGVGGFDPEHSINT
jgi:hypothetical protein